MVFPDYYLIEENGEVIEIIRRHNFDTVELYDQPAHGACTMIRKACLEDIGGYDETYQCQDGYDLWIRFIEKYKIQNVNLPLFYYRRHECNLTGDENRILRTRSDIIEKHAKRNGRRLSAVGVIPVRGKSMNPGSQALKLLNGKPLVDWTIENALDSNRLSNVVVTTPDEELRNHVTAKYGNCVICVQREKKLAQLNTPIEDTLFHVLESISKMELVPDAISLLYIEAPFRSSKHIDNAIDILEIFNTDTVIGVRPEFYDIYQHDGCGLQPIRKSRSLRLEREEVLKDVGRMHCVTRRFLETHLQVVGGKIGHIILDEMSAINVSTEWEWEIAQLAAQRIC